MTEARPSGYRYPFAAAPDIIRSNQKDAYFQGVLLEQLTDIIRSFKGARFAHNYTSETRTVAELLYLSLTTLIGNRTLGEEYCDIVQVEDDTRRLPALLRRSGYIASTVLLPYWLGRVLPALRKRVRGKLEVVLRKGKGREGSVAHKLQTYLHDNLDTLTSPSPAYAVGLAVFYFSGAYYHLGKRLWGLRYIFTRTVEPSSQRVGYEVLGVLLVLQLSVQAYLHVHSTYTQNRTTVANVGSAVGTSVVVGHGVEVSLDPIAYSSNNALLFESDPNPTPSTDKSALKKITHTPVLEEPRYSLEDKETMAWIVGRQQRKCTLCLEPMKDPSVTTCGHCFCWTCIGDWVREKPECPLCRQSVLVQHILPLRG